MKKLSIRLLLFLLPIFILFFIIDRVISAMPSTFMEKKALFEKQHDSIEVLVLGASYSLHGIDPQFFSHRGFNIANPNQTLYYDTRITLKHLNELPKLKLVIIPVDYTSLHMQMSDGPERWRDYLYFRYWGIKSKDMSFLDIPEYEYMILKMNYELRQMKSKEHGNLNNFGFIPLDSANHLQRISDAMGKNIAITYKGYSYKRNEAGYIYNDLDNFLAVLKSKNITAVFISTPAYTSFSKYADTGLVAQNHRSIEKLCLKYNCKYFNYFKDTRFDIDDFSENCHLDVYGAEKLSKIIDSEIIKPYFK